MPEPVSRPGLWLLSLLALAGCATPPDLPPIPAVDAPEAFHAQAMADGPPARPGMAGSWWRALGDPQLEQLVATALANNRDLLAGKARIDQARALAALDQSARQPSLSLNPQAGRSRSSDNVDAGVSITSPGGSLPPLNVTPSTYQTRWRLPLEATYEPDLWDRLSLTAQASVQRIQASEQDLELARQALVASVVSSHHLLGVHRAQQALLQEIVLRDERRLNALQAKLAAGLADGTELATLQIEAASTRSRLRQSQEQIDLDLHVLALLCGTSAGRLSAPPPPALDPGERLARLPMLADLPARVLERRPDVRSTQARLAAELSELGAARAEFFPSLRLTGQSGLESAALSQLLDSGSLIWSLAAQIDIPLLDGGRRDARFAAARARLDEAARLHENTVLQALREVEDALVSAGSRQAQVAQEQMATEAAERLARQASERADAGLGTSLRAMERQQAALQQRLALLDVQGQAFVARITLLKVLAYP